MFDIILEYCDEHKVDFDVDDFIQQLRSHKGLKEYIKKDMLDFNFCKNLNIPDSFAELF